MGLLAKAEVRQPIGFLCIRYTETLEPQSQQRPILFVDVDGVISLFGFSPGEAQLPGPLHWIDGVALFIPDDVGARLVTLAERFELVWATG